MSDLELRLEPKQALRISPQLLQATRMLLMPAQELSHFLERAAEENPLLERIEHRTNARGSSEPVTFVFRPGSRALGQRHGIPFRQPHRAAGA